jgi:hypothetical protein
MEVAAKEGRGGEKRGLKMRSILFPSACAALNSQDKLGGFEHRKRTENIYIYIYIYIKRERKIHLKNNLKKRK